MINWTLIQGIILAVYMLLSGSLLAGEVPEGKVRIITPNKATSDCIGDPKTPLCSIETVIGCSSYVWTKGCEKVNYVHSENRQLRIEYIFVKVGYVDPELVAKAKYEEVPSGFGSFPWLTKDSFQAKVKERSCPVEQKNCKKSPWTLKFYSVSPHGNYWTWAYAGIFDPYNWFVKK